MFVLLFYVLLMSANYCMVFTGSGVQRDRHALDQLIDYDALIAVFLY